jgi:phospholipid/cholesterol/gamma-HCH transport system substrate-binding protein
MQLRVGALLALGLGLGLAGLLFPTRGVSPFTPKFKLRTYFDEVAGLRASSPVWFAGLEVGKVTRVELQPNGYPPKVLVEMTIEHSIVRYIKQDSRAIIEGMGLLGDMNVKLLPGTAQALPAVNGQELEGMPLSNVEDEFRALIQSLRKTAANLEEMGDAAVAGRGLVGRLFMDETLAQRLESVMLQVEKITAGLDAKDGTLHRLLNEPEVYEELLAAIREIKALAGQWREGSENLLSPKTQATLEKTLATTEAVVADVEQARSRLSQVKVTARGGVHQYFENALGAEAAIMLWPSHRQYFQVGLRGYSELIGQETRKLSLDANLGWRLWDSPLYVRTGVTRTDSIAAGLDLRLLQDKLVLETTAHRFDLNPAQLDSTLGVVITDLIELTAGAEDLLRDPHFRAGIMLR